MPRYSRPTRLLAAGPLPGHLRVGFCKLADRSHSLPPVQRFFSCSVRRLSVKNWGTGGQKDWAPAYPQAPPAWVAAVNGVFTTWGDDPPAALIDKGNGAGYYNRVPAFEQKVVSSGWTDFDKVKTNTTGVWKSQAATASSLLMPTNLTADAYFFLLHLVIGLATVDAARQALAQRIIAAPTGSVEYPNDTFLNQLGVPDAHQPGRSARPVPP